MQLPRSLFVMQSFLIIAMSSGCVAIINDYKFEGHSRLPIADGMTCSVHLTPEYTKKILPVIYHYYSEKGPYDLSLSFHSKGRSAKTVEIDEIQFVFSDAHYHPLTETQSRPFEPVVLTNGKEIDEMELDWTFDDIVSRYDKVRIQIRGRVKNSEGESVDFSIDEDFDTKKSVYITTIFQIWMGV